MSNRASQISTATNPSRTLVIGDIHGGYRALNEVLTRAEITREDQLIFLGDYVDGWSESDKVISTLIELKQDYQCIFLRGNHDDLFQQWLETKAHNPLWLNHGGAATIKAYDTVSESKTQDHLQFLNTLKNYHIDQANRLFLHAGFTNLHGPKREYASHVFYWDRTLWEMAVAADPRLQPQDKRYPKRLTHFKEIYIGHTPTTRLGYSEPTHALNVWNIDTGAAFKGRLTLFDADQKSSYQSNPVFKLYPEERGRN